MRHTLRSGLLLALILLLSVPSIACHRDRSVTFNGVKYRLALSDDFDSFEESNWAYCPEEMRQDAGGWWRDSCTEVAGGNLVITCAIDENGIPVSGGIRSTPDHEQAYGLYHMRFKMEKAEGLWYAFWLMTDQMSDATAGNGATDGAELDIIEVVPHAEILCMSVHWDGYGANKMSCSVSLTVDDSFYDDYHELWYQWTEEGYRLYMDGTDEDSLLFFFPGDQYGDGTCAVPCGLIISAEYGTWGGAIDPEQLPAHFFVDYVKIYQPEKE